MAVVTLNIPDAQVSRVVTALCAVRGKTPANAANAKAALVDIIRDIVIAQERNAAEQAALAAVVTPTDPGVS